MPNIVQPGDGSFRIEGYDGPLYSGTIVVHSDWLATSVDKVFFTTPRALRVVAIYARVEAAGTDGSAVTAVVKKAASGTAIASGTALHSSSINLKGTAATNQVLTLSTTSTDLDLAQGDSIGIDFTGVLTAATGVVTVLLAPK
jgi:hypothetical protein